MQDWWLSMTTVEIWEAFRLNLIYAVLIGCQSKKKGGFSFWEKMGHALDAW
jgi:hypothetical protein